MDKPTVTLGDRIAASFAMFLASAITALVIWAVLAFLLIKTGNDVFVSFSSVYYFTAFFTLLAFIVPDLSLNILAGIWKPVDRFIKNLSRE